MATKMTEAVKLAAAAHDGQVDKLGVPYILHPLAVAARVPLDNEAAQLAAVLHDVVEDSSLEVDQITASFGQEVGEAVDALTRREGETYKDFIRRCGENPVARIVKLADLRHNLDRLPHLYEIDYERAKSLRGRYVEADRYLSEIEGLRPAS